MDNTRSTLHVNTVQDEVIAKLREFADLDFFEQVVTKNYTPGHPTVFSYAHETPERWYLFTLHVGDPDPTQDGWILRSVDYPHQNRGAINDVKRRFHYGKTVGRIGGN